MGYNIYEVRGSDVYPSVSDDFDYCGLPMFEIRGSEVYPTASNNRDDYGLPAFEIRDGYAYPTAFNSHDDSGFEVCQEDTDHDSSTGSADSPADDTDLSFRDLAALAAIGVGLAAGARAHGRVQKRRQKASERTHATKRPLTGSGPVSPPGWYPTEFGPRYWNGWVWTPAMPPAGPYAYQPALAFPVRPNSAAAIATAWILTALTCGYLLPWAVAVTRSTSNCTSVGLITFFLGWTVVGWVAALVMACTGRGAMTPRYHP